MALAWQVGEASLKEVAGMGKLVLGHAPFPPRVCSLFTPDLTVSEYPDLKFAVGAASACGIGGS